VQSSVFNFSIMIATGVAGVLLTRNPESGVKNIVWMSLFCFVAAIVVAFMVTRASKRASSPATIEP